ncbi:unnamed protein product [Paramecium pentaurelia]|uniref:Cyclic nucleotide-binding domain-containing protein n=1 Tax=Paramecium pentaurelia TaxID=43138 RepID=A0A8S1STG8_9CILI|nr:unnamed protein product [Paramecium pentaurelia]
MNEIKQNEYLQKSRKEKEWLNRKQLKYLRDITVTSDDSGDELEKKKEFKILLKQRRKFQWEQRSLNFMNSKHSRLYSKTCAMKFHHYLILLNSQIRKLKKHLAPQRPYTMTPDGSIKLIWDLICLGFVIYEMIGIPFQISFEIEISNEIQNLSLGVFIFDILLNFNTGVYIDGALQMDRRYIFKNYLQFWFWIDMISTFPYEIIIDESQQLIQSAKLLRLFKFLKFVRVLKLLRLAKLKKIIDKIDEYIQTSRIIGVIITFIKLFVFVLFFAHVLGCIFHYTAIQEEYSWLGDQEEEYDWQTRYINSLYWGVATMTTVGYGDISPQTPVERLLGIFLLLVACGGFAFTMNSIGFALSSLEEKSNIRKQKVSLLNKYMKKANIPDVLQNKVRKYLEFVWDSHQILLKDITKLLSDELGKDIQELVNGKLFGHADIIWHLHTKRFLIQAIIPILEDKLFFPEEIIFLEIPSITNDLYLIQKGSVDIYFMKTNIVIDNKIKNDYFGEISFYSNQLRSASAISRTFSHIFVLNQQKFLEIAKSYPKDLQQYFKVRNAIIFESDYSYLQIRCYVCQMDDHLAKECPVLHFQVNAPHFLSFLHQYRKIEETVYIRKDRRDFNARFSAYQVQQTQKRFIKINNKRISFLGSKGIVDTIFNNYYNIEDDNNSIEDDTPSRIITSLQVSIFNNKNKKKFDQIEFNYEESSHHSKKKVGQLTQRIIIEDQYIDQIATNRFHDLLEQINTLKYKKQIFQQINFSEIPNFDKVSSFHNFCQRYNIECVLERYHKIQKRGSISQIPPKYSSFGVEEFQSYLQYYCFYLKQDDLKRYFTKSQLKKKEMIFEFENTRVFNLTRVEKKRNQFITKNSKFRSVVTKIQSLNSLKSNSRISF